MSLPLIRTTYSLQQSPITIGKLVSRAKKLGHTFLALTDICTMAGVQRFYRHCKENDIHPLLGTEVRILYPEDPAYYSLVLLARNNTGYKNLIQIISSAYQVHHLFKPHITTPVLARYSEGLFVLSGGLNGYIPNLILNGYRQEAEKDALEYYDLFPGWFYLELQAGRNETTEYVNENLVSIHKKTGIPLVSASETFFLEDQDFDLFCALQSQYIKQDIQRLLGSGAQHMEPAFLAMAVTEYEKYRSAYLHSQEWMKRRFKDYPEAEQNAGLIAKKCRVNFKPSLHSPRFPVSEEFRDAYDQLYVLALKGVQEHFTCPSGNVLERLYSELDVIRKSGWSNYFLIIHDMVLFAKEQGILVGPGRGSSAGSLLLYCIGITDVDPLEHGLLFERFLNPERNSMPDIDVDFDSERRQEVVDYLLTRYGKNSAVHLAIYYNWSARSAIRDAGRALGFSLDQIRKITDIIRPGDHVSCLDDKKAELEMDFANSRSLSSLFEIAKGLEGLVRGRAIHSSCLALGNNNLFSCVPFCRDRNGVRMSEYDARDVEYSGLLKIDILGLPALALLNRITRKIRAGGADLFQLKDIPIDDEKTWALIASGKTAGVFQLNSDGIQEILRDLQPSNLEHLSALLAMYRPGPLEKGFMASYIFRKNGKEEYTLPHPDLADILNETFGVLVYQEQLMQIVSRLSGLKLAEADFMRRQLMQRDPVVTSEMKRLIKKLALEKGFNEKTILSVLDLLEDQGRYTFNKSHSVSYAFTAYKIAYMKTNHPDKFYASFLAMQKGDLPGKNPVMIEARNMGYLPCEPGEHSLFRGIEFPVPEPSFSQFASLADKEKIKASGIVTNLEKRKIKKHCRNITFLLTHPRGTVLVCLWAKEAEKWKPLLKDGLPVEILGHKESFQQSMFLVPEDIRILEHCS